MTPRAAVRRGMPPATAGVSAPADRRFRRPDLRPGRRRRLIQVALRTGRWAATSAVVGGVLFWLGATVLGSELLRVRQLVVKGNVRLSVGEVEALVDGIRGERIFNVNFEEYRRRLMDSPWVASVSLWRVLPSTVEVRVLERTPLVIARLGQQLYLVDERGVIIDEYGPQYREFDLPIVDGLIAPVHVKGPLVAPDRIALVGSLLRAFGEHPALGRRLSQIDVSNPRDAVVLLDDDAVLLHLGETRFVERVQSYLELGPTLRERLPEIDSVDLRFDERLYVRSKSTHETKAVKR
jgi:cell division septal protein FtsQ